MKKTNEYPRNTRILVANNGNKPGFNVYLDFSGQTEYLCLNRHNGLVYGLLKDGMDLNELARRKKAIVSRFNRASKIESSLNRLLNAAQVYIAERDSVA